MKKFQDYYGRILLRFLSKKTVRVMKLTLFLSILAISQLWASESYSQLTKLSLKLEDVKISDALKEIENESEFFFLYSPKLIDVERKVNIDAENEPIKDILANIFDEKVKFAVYGQQIILTPNEQSGILSSFQQQNKITGTVTDETENPLPGVNIQVEGTTIGTFSDVNGKYTINVSDNNAVLTFTFIGYTTKRVSYGGKTPINVTMVQETTSLEEVVVIGYGSVKKSSITASVAKLDNKSLAQIPTSSVELAMVGRMSGVNISNSRNTPGEAPLIRIRGAGSVSAGNDPLVVIDGFPGGSLSQLDMNDIQSIEVLKDASSAAIYGSRGSGGVILVTTKKGKTGAPKVNFNAYSGFAKAMLFNDWMTGQEWYNYLVKFQNREFVWVGGDPSLPIWGDPRRPSKYQVNPIALQEPQTIWQNEVFHSAPIQSYNLSFSGGNSNVKYYVSGTYKDEEGAIKTASYKSYSLKANVDVKVNNIVSTGIMFTSSFAKRRIAGSQMVSLVKYPPFVPPVAADGTLYPTAREMANGFTGQDNPLHLLYGTFNNNSTFSNLGTAYITVDLADGLQLRTSIGSNIDYSTSDYFQEGMRNTDNHNGSAGDYHSINVINENVLSYTKTLNKVHEINALVGASYQDDKSRNLSMEAVGGTFNNSIIHTLNNAIIDPGATYSTMSEWGLISYFSRVNYGYKEKYLLTASVRTDGCSRFGADNKWGYFPSASIAWSVSKENFMQNIPTISELKIRASYGVTGNFNIGDFDYLGKIVSTNYSPDNILVTGQAQSTFQNSKLGWEKTISNDFGIELGLFKNRLNFVFDYYTKRTSDLLYNVSIPAITGFSNTLSNIGEISNNGIEFEINTKNLVGVFNWQTFFNLSRNKNKVSDLGGVQEIIIQGYKGMNSILRVGEPMFSYYGYKVIGVLQNAEDVANSPILVGEKPGNPKYLDVNKDGKITPSDDKIILGNFQPKIFLGMTNNFSWKNFDLGITMVSSLGAKMFNLEISNYEGAVLGAMRRSLAERQWWSEEDPGSGKWPGMAADSQQSFLDPTDLYIENSSYFSINNINFGYTLSDIITKKIGISNFRIYTSINNLLFIKNKSNHSYNPEGYTFGEIQGVDSTPGFNYGSEPLNRVVTFGVNLSF